MVLQFSRIRIIEFFFIYFPTFKYVNTPVVNHRVVIGFFSLCFFGSLLISIGSDHALGQNSKKPVSNPIGVGSGWQAEVTQGDKDSAPQDMDDQTRSFVQSISDYFNAIKYMQGRFIQTNPDRERTKGRFYVKRPGKLRFDYAAPSKLRIVADGRWLSIEDHDLKTYDRYPLESTPFRLLLAKKVDFLRDAKVVDISRGEEIAIISVTDKQDDASGQLKLFFAIPELQLLQWVITDPQGLDTKIEIVNLLLDQKKRDNFFEIADETEQFISD